MDGAPLPKIKLDALRQGLALVPQEPQIFSGTVRENICYGDADAQPKQIVAAAKAAEIHDFIMQLPVRYETLLGERGTTLSGGQRQRLSLARAVLSNPEVILLDDCTSALDADTEQKIQETLMRILKGRTAVIVTQRVSMAQRCHNICVLDDGVIGEIGTHNALLAQRGFYARLYAQQTGTPHT
jgi:ABC-type multidrug transport system fused ATPase/permease subunit